jgi:methyltransferase (TIGR00027 family)
MCRLTGSAHEHEEAHVTYPLLESTAYWAAAVRAHESAREDRLFEDPWAKALAGQEGAAWMAQRTPESISPMVLRTRYYDEVLQRLARQHGIRQIVLLAAGLDTRAYRLPWPQGTRFYELDQPAVLGYKEEVLRDAGAQPNCERHAIASDLTTPWQEALVGGGFDPQRPSGWLLEGFLFYLPNEAVSRIIDGVSALAAPGSWMGLDVVNSLVLTSPYTRPWIEMQAKAGAPWIGTMNDPEGFLAACGWQASLTQVGAADANWGRVGRPVPPVKMPNMPHHWLVTARKIET